MVVWGQEAWMCSFVGHEGECWSSLCGSLRGVHWLKDCKLFCVYLGLCISRTANFSFLVDLYSQQNKRVVKVILFFLKGSFI